MVDKKFLMFYEYHQQKDGTFKTDTYDFTKKPGENTRAARHNLLLDMAKSIWSHPDISDQINHPGSFDNIKIAARIMDIFDDASLREQWEQEHGCTNTKDLWESLENASLDEIDDFLKKTKQEMSPMGLDTYIYNHQQNMAGAGLIGIYANNNTGQAKMQDTHVKIKIPYIIDGRVVDDITNQYTITSKGTKKLISQYAAEFLAASVDNVKDPNLAKLMQKPDTAFLACYMLRLGFNINQIGLVYKHPSVEAIINATGTISERYLRDNPLTVEETKFFEGVLSTAHNDSVFNTLDFVDLQKGKISYKNKMKSVVEAMKSLEEEKKANPSIEITPGLIITRAGLDSEDYLNLIAYAQLKVDTAATITKMLKEAVIIRVLTQLSRADSPNGAIGISMPQAIIQKQALDVFNFNMDDESELNPFTGLQTLINNQAGLATKSRQELEDIFMSKSLSMLQAFHNLGINSSFELLKPYFPALNRVGMSEIKHIMGQTSTHMTTEKVLNTYMKAATVYNMSKSSLFGNDSNHTAREKRTYFLYKFPGEFDKFKLNNPDFSRVGVIKNLQVTDGRIMLMRAARLTPDVREKFMRDFDYLMQSKDPKVRDMTVKLFMYSFYNDGLYFGPNSFGGFFSTDFMLNIPGYRESLERANKQEYNEKLLQQFYYYNQNQYVYPGINPMSIKSANKDHSSIVMEKKTVYNAFGKATGLDSIYPYIRVGGRFYRATQSTFKTVTYSEMPEFKKDVFGTPHYDPNLTIEEIISGLPSADIVNKAKMVGMSDAAAIMQQDTSGAAANFVATYEADQRTSQETITDPDIEGSQQAEGMMYSDPELVTLDTYQRKMGTTPQGQTTQAPSDMMSVADDPELMTGSLEDILRRRKAKKQYNSQEGLDEQGITRC